MYFALPYSRAIFSLETIMAFYQIPPRLNNQYLTDPLIREYVERVLPEDIRADVDEQYHQLGALSGDEYYRLQRLDLSHQPAHEPWDAWGRRVDRITLTPLWHKAQVLAAERGLVAAAYDNRYGRYDRIHQFVMNYLISPSLDVYACPLAMTDGAARSLLASGATDLIERAVPRLTSRDPADMWTSGQWMTERTGGSDVSASETIAVPGPMAPDGPNPGDPAQPDLWRLYGTKWFTSATTSEMALALARPQVDDGQTVAGSRGLALFYIELRDADGNLRNIEINRLKDKLGTRKVPTAELSLCGTPARLVGAPNHGVRAIAPMLNITRTWNAVMAAAGMRRALALAKDYAHKRRAFGALLAEKPLHVDTLATMQAEAEGAALLALRAAELLGHIEHPSADANAATEVLARVMIPIAKLTTGKQAVAVASEALECFGGAGYVEDTGLPRLLADAQVLPIWEGTTNVLSLDTLRALSQGDGNGDGPQVLFGELERLVAGVSDPGLMPCVDRVRQTGKRAMSWLARARGERARLEAGARRFALTLGRTLELALLCHHAQDCLHRGAGIRAAAVARRFALAGIDLIPQDDNADEMAADVALMMDHS